MKPLEDSICKWVDWGSVGSFLSFHSNSNEFVEGLFFICCDVSKPLPFQRWLVINQSFVITWLESTFIWTISNVGRFGMISVRSEGSNKRNKQEFSFSFGDFSLSRVNVAQSFTKFLLLLLLLLLFFFLFIFFFCWTGEVIETWSENRDCRDGTPSFVFDLFQDFGTKI